VAVASCPADRRGFQIPFPAPAKAALGRQLDVNQLKMLRAVDGYHDTAVTFDRLISPTPLDAGGELRTTCAMFHMMGTVFTALGISTIRLAYNIHLNKTERNAGSISSAVAKKGAVYNLRPDTLLVVDVATLLIGEDKVEGQRDQAIADIKAYVKDGINAHHYGAIPGLLAYAASGLELNFLLVKPTGEVRVGALPLWKWRIPACCLSTYLAPFALLASWLRAARRRKEVPCYFVWLKSNTPHVAWLLVLI
jgi:hypothetical protein